MTPFMNAMMLAGLASRTMGKDGVPHIPASYGQSVPSNAQPSPMPQPSLMQQFMLNRSYSAPPLPGLLMQYLGGL